jgi:hypothetical protein
MSDAVVFDSAHFVLSPLEAQSLVDPINQYLKGSGHAIERATPSRWYLLSETLITPAVPTLQEMQRRAVGGVLTDSRIAPEWRRLMNELQIVLHQQPVNAERDRHGELPINGVWIHTGGAVETYEYRVSRVITRSSHARVLGTDLGLYWAEELTEPVAPPDGGDILVFDESLAVPTSYRARRTVLESMEARWFRPAFLWLRQRMISEIVIDGVDGRRFVIRRRHLYRFWRRPQSLGIYAGQIS